MAVFLPIVVWPATFLITQRIAAKQQERLRDDGLPLGGDRPRGRLAARAGGAGSWRAGGRGRGRAGTFGLEEVCSRAGGLSGRHRRRLAPRLRRGAAGGHADHRARPVAAEEQATPTAPTAKPRNASATARVRAKPRPRRGKTPDREIKAPELPSPVPLYRVHFRDDRYLSREAFDRLERALGRANDLRREGLLLARGFPARPSELGDDRDQGPRQRRRSRPVSSSDASSARCWCRS